MKGTTMGHEIISNGTTEKDGEIVVDEYEPDSGEAYSETAVLSQIYEYLLKREWKKKFAKSTGTTLFHHSICELNVLSRLLPLLNFYSLSKKDYEILQLAILAHDSGKETEEWQRYLFENEKYQRGIRAEKPKFVSHINSEISRSIVNDLSKIMKFKTQNERVMTTILGIIENHMKKERKDAGRAFQRILEQKEEKIEEKWKDLAMIISFIDDISSCENVDDAYQVLNNIERSREYEKLRQYLVVRYHKVNKVRGITTSLLHEAMESTYKECGFIPVLYFPEGTIYIGLKGKIIDFSREKIFEKFEYVLNKFIGIFEDKNARIVVGKPNASSISTEILFSKEQLKRYLEVVIKKNREKGPMDIDKTIEYLKIKQVSDLKLIKGYNQKKKEVEKDLNSRPELFKRILAELGMEKSQVNPENVFSILEKTEKQRNEFYQKYNINGDIVEEKLKNIRIWLGRSYPYNALFEFVNTLINNKNLVNDNAREFLIREIAEKFGAINENKEDYKKMLPVTGSYNPLPYQILFVDHLEKIFGENFEENVILWIVNLFNEAWDEYGFIPKTIEENIEVLVSSDLAFPFFVDFFEKATNSNRYYALSKDQALSVKSTAQKMCLICNTYFTGENRAISDIVGFSKKFTNRLTGGKPLNNVNICKACELEYLLRYLTLGNRPEELAVVYPETNITFELGRSLEKKIREFEQGILEINSPQAMDISKTIRLSNLDKLSREIINKGINIFENFTVKNLIDIIVFSRNIKKSEKMMKLGEQFQNILKKSYGWDNIEQFNEDNKSCYQSFGEVINDIIKGENLNRNFIKEIREKVENKERKLREEQVDLCAVYITPNFVVILFSALQSLKTDDISESDLGLRKLLLSSALSYVFDSPIALIESEEQIPEKPQGIVWIPPVGNIVRIVDRIRKLKNIPRKELWLSMEERDIWTNLLSCALFIKEKAGLSKRTGIFEVLTMPTEGHLMRKIEMKNNYLGSEELRALHKLEEMEVLT